VASVGGGRIIAAAGGGSLLELLELQPAGKKRLNAGDFCRGYRLAAGERLGD
jgi:methionyl-tRNA formyltransferase